MTLRQRLALTTLAVGLPLLGGISWFHNYSRERAAEEAFTQLAALHMQGGGRARCEADPAEWVEGPLHLGPEGVHLTPWDGPLSALRASHPPAPWLGEIGRKPNGTSFGLQLYAYDANLMAQNPSAPRLSDAIKAALLPGKPSATAAQANCEFAVLVRMAWSDGPCTHVLVCRPEGHGRNTIDRLTPPLTAVFLTLTVALVSLFGP